jgi:hypothetical protein
MSKYNPLKVLLVAAVAFTLAACGDDDNPVDSDHDEHAEAVGLVITDSGAEIVRDERGTVTGEIEVGVERETTLLSVRFLAEDGDLFVPEDDHYSLGFEIADESIAEIEWHEEDGKWAFHVVGHAAGETTIRLKIMHDDHADFVSRPLEIHVTEGGPGEEHDEHDHDDE